MKFTTSKSELLEVLSITGKAISKSSTIPILTSYLFEIVGTELSVTAGSLDFYMTKQLTVDVDGHGISVAIPGVKLLNLIKELPDQPINFAFRDFELTISALTGNYVIPCEDGQDFPRMSAIESESFDLDYPSLLKGISKTIFTCSTDELRPQITGVYLVISNGTATFTATNAAALSTIGFDTGLTEKIEIIIPVKILKALQQLRSVKAKITLNEKNIQFNLDDGSILQSVLIDAKFPDYECVIPRKNEKHAVVERQQLMGSLKRVSQFSEIAKDGVVKLTFSPGKCILQCSNITMGENAQEELSVQYDGEKLEIGMAATLLLLCLINTDVDEVSLWLSAPNRAMIIAEDSSPIETKKDLMLIMPVVLLGTISK